METVELGVPSDPANRPRGPGPGGLGVSTGMQLRVWKMQRSVKEQGAYSMSEKLWRPYVQLLRQLLRKDLPMSYEVDVQYWS